MSPKTLTTIKKRDGSIVPFDKARIVRAIFKAADSLSAFDEKVRNGQNFSLQFLSFQIS